ncbi:hypothetical protein H312_00570 [Anncaliia algerae PRA339]|uniref:Uncharacterized protein n=1 Tax=Anncaliia algerae PRA339 TaxID=1288291 RepID=A0A059F4T8_9MICR|nr:hypothetical protein H312_00570 [Anncaliia algerae PRA339]
MALINISKKLRPMNMLLVIVKILYCANQELPQNEISDTDLENYWDYENIYGKRNELKCIIKTSNKLLSPLINLCERLYPNLDSYSSSYFDSNQSNDQDNHSDLILKMKRIYNFDIHKLEIIAFKYRNDVKQQIGKLIFEISRMFSDYCFLNLSQISNERLLVKFYNVKTHLKEHNENLYHEYKNIRKTIKKFKLFPEIMNKENQTGINYKESTLVLLKELVENRKRFYLRLNETYLYVSKSNKFFKSLNIILKFKTKALLAEKNHIILLFKQKIIRKIKHIEEQEIWIKDWFKDFNKRNKNVNNKRFNIKIEKNKVIFINSDETEADQDDKHANNFFSIKNYDFSIDCDLNMKYFELFTDYYVLQILVRDYFRRREEFDMKQDVDFDKDGRYYKYSLLNGFIVCDLFKFNSSFRSFISICDYIIKYLYAKKAKALTDLYNLYSKVKMIKEIKLDAYIENTSTSLFDENAEIDCLKFLSNNRFLSKHKIDHIYAKFLRRVQEVIKLKFKIKYDYTLKRKFVFNQIFNQIFEELFLNNSLSRLSALKIKNTLFKNTDISDNFVDKWPEVEKYELRKYHSKILRIYICKLIRRIIVET